MFKWLIKLLVKPIIKPVKEGIKLCNKLTETLDTLSKTIKNLPLEDSFKVELLTNVKSGIDAVLTVRDVLVNVLKYIGEDPTVEYSESTIEEMIESVKKSLK